MVDVSVIVVGVILAGLAFDFVNGFHDASNSIATVVATRVLKPRAAVLWAAFFNVVALFFFGTHVAKTVGSGLISLDFVTPTVILCGLIGAIVWGLLTWWWGLPTSSSHALIGGYAGAAMAHAVAQRGLSSFAEPIIASGWIRVLAFIVIAPVIGLLIALFLERFLMFAARKEWFKLGDRTYRRLQLLSSALLSLMHGGNDAQKTAGIIAGALTAAGYFETFTIPLWVVIISYTTIGMGTFFGGWRIVRTMGHRLTHLDAQGGVCAECASAIAILSATNIGLPVSTTHVTTGSILGVGVATKGRRVRWSVVRNIMWAWVFTIPAAATVGCLTMFVVGLMGG